MVAGMKFEVGKFYKCRDGGKAVVWMLDNGEGCMLGAVQCDDGNWGVSVWEKGINTQAKCSDLVAEWREPIKYSVEVWGNTWGPASDSSSVHHYVFGQWSHWSIDKCERTPIKYRVTVEEVPE
jgi:hypothetical protein